MTEMNLPKLENTKMRLLISFSFYPMNKVLSFNIRAIGPPFLAIAI